MNIFDLLDLVFEDTKESYSCIKFSSIVKSLSVNSKRNNYTFDEVMQKKSIKQKVIKIKKNYHCFKGITIKDKRKRLVFVYA